MILDYLLKNIKYFFGKSNCNFKPLDFNLIDKIWKREIEKSQNNFYLLPKYSGSDNYKLKIKKILSNLKKKNADFLLLHQAKIMHGYLILEVKIQNTLRYHIVIH